MPALSTMVQFVEHNAFYACMFCNTKGTYSHEGHCIVYSIDKDTELRTSENFEKCAQLAASIAFSEILDVPLPHSVVIDAMHTVFLCHSKKLLIHLQTFITKKNLLKINLKLRPVKFIHDILRRTRSFVNVQKWKASEVRLFILYIGLPVLVEFLPEDVCGDLALYNTILRLLHDYWENDKKLSDAISSLLKIYIKNLSKNINANLCPPKLLTISTHIHLHLPLQCKKFGRLDWFTNVVFESFLGFLKAFVEGSSGAGNQIAIAFISNFFLPKTKENKNHLCGHFCINNETFGSNILKMKIDFVDNVYIVVKHVERSLCEYDCSDVYSISTLRSRCFSVPFGDELKILTNYSCAYEHN
ncbi:unnamed protein product [Rotaria magnacalcarata]